MSAFSIIRHSYAVLFRWEVLRWKILFTKTKFVQLATACNASGTSFNMRYNGTSEYPYYRRSPSGPVSANSAGRFYPRLFRRTPQMYLFPEVVTPWYMTTFSHALPNVVGPINWCIACCFWQRVLLLVLQGCRRPLTEKIQLANCTAYILHTALWLFPVSAALLEYI